jgi:hypothetical protein
MFQRYAAVLLLAVCPGLAVAQEPERFLPPASQFYLRWDGLDAHRQAFDQSAVGKMFQGETGTFFSELVAYAEKHAGRFLEDSGVERRSVELIAEVPKILRIVGKHGFRLGIALNRAAPVDIEAALVLPRAGKTDGPLFTFLRKAFEQSGAEIKTTKDGKNTTYQIDFEAVQLRWFDSGDDAVIWIGVHHVRTPAKAEFTANPLYKELKQFKDFKTWGDGFLDLTSLANIAGQINPDINKLIDDLGLRGIRNITFHSGFDGSAERSLVLIDIPGPRKGLLRIANQRKLRMADLPPLPADATSFSISNLDLPKLYDVVLEGIQSGLRIFAPGSEDSVKTGIQFFENLIGVKLREDLIGSLGDVFAQYRTPAEGPLGLGTVYLVKIKDAKKLQEAADKLLDLAGKLPNVEVKNKLYRGAAITELHANYPGNFYVYSLTIHKGWVAFSLYPQPLRGFILRAAGDVKTWKTDADLQRRLDQFPKEFVSLSISDPRPTVEFLCSLAPTGLAALNGFLARDGSAFQFDPSLVPNAHEATRHLFPNITVTTDDGRKIRIETRASLALPF